jgi:hypothetical protein
MELECQATIEQQDEEDAWVHWSLVPRDGGPPVAEGRVRYELETVHFYWQDGRPPAEHEFLVRTTIDRAIRGRSASTRG